MDLQLKGKTAFITGSTAGIGFATAKLLLQEGANVIINGRKESSVSTAVEKLKKLVPNTEVKGVSADFSSINEIEVLLTKIPSTDILINNVGIYTSQTFFDTTDEDWLKQIEVNVLSGVRLSKYFLPKMLQKKWGRIIFISSECASLVPEDLIAYSTTKAAVLALSRGLSQLTSGTDVTVNTLIPGSTLTEGAEQFLSNMAEKENKTRVQVENDFFEKVRTSSLLQRFTSVEEIANTIAFYASPLSSATNGAAIKMEGGSMGGIL